MPSRDFKNFIVVPVNQSVEIHKTETQLTA
jgi:hypothetical protein